MGSHFIISTSVSLRRSCAMGGLAGLFRTPLQWDILTPCEIRETAANCVDTRPRSSLLQLPLRRSRLYQYGLVHGPLPGFPGVRRSRQHGIAFDTPHWLDCARRDQTPGRRPRLRGGWTYLLCRQSESSPQPGCSTRVFPIVSGAAVASEARNHTSGVLVCMVGFATLTRHAHGPLQECGALNN